MRKKTLYLSGTALLLGFAGFALLSFQQTLTPYVAFAQARSLERTLQVAGELVEDSSQYDGDAEALLFRLREPTTGETLNVVYHGLKPANFEEAVSIVAIGRYEPAVGSFQAEKLLVKCPSKYQGLEGTETKEYSSSSRPVGG